MMQKIAVMGDMQHALGLTCSTQLHGHVLFLLLAPEPELLVAAVGLVAAAVLVVVAGGEYTCVL